jgi:hypothetical protein
LSLEMVGVASTSAVGWSTAFEHPDVPVVQRTHVACRALFGRARGRGDTGRLSLPGCVGFGLGGAAVRAKSNRDDNRAKLFGDLLSKQPSVACSQVVVVGVTWAPGAGIGRDAVAE